MKDYQKLGLLGTSMFAFGLAWVLGEPGVILMILGGVIAVNGFLVGVFQYSGRKDCDDESSSEALADSSRAGYAWCCCDPEGLVDPPSEIKHRANCRYWYVFPENTRPESE